MEVYYKQSFVKQLKKLDEDLRKEIIAKIELFKDKENYKFLEVHKLKGRLKNFYSFSVNYRYRIVFQYESKNEVVLLMVGDHDVYR